MRWSGKNNRWNYHIYKCNECDKEFNAHGAYMQHVNYDHRKNKKSKKSFPQAMQTASHLLLVGFLAKKMLTI